MAMSADELLALHKDLMARNELTEGLIYLQVTAGAYGARDFAGPETLTPGLFLFTTAKPLITDVARDGIHAISVHDTRWARRVMKTPQLLSQALAYREARRAGAETAWLHEDGIVTEAASANAWIVTTDNTLVTRNLSHSLLPGITRQSIIRLMADHDYTIEERAFTLDEAYAASEAFTTSTGVVIAPVLSMDGKPIGSGKPGPVTRAVQRHYYEYFGADVASIAPWALA
jgi:D-alanine transaminase